MKLAFCYCCHSNMANISHTGQGLPSEPHRCYGLQILICG
uniref:DNA mismatch repair protein mlh1, putative n=1 Tax=Arundo donax TaxID=35708 RepID=A0A0A9EBD6_ARUDO